MNREPKTVLVVGGGVIGCAVAYYLAKRGIAVTVIDKGRIGYGCSYGNAGWLVPSHAMPLPMPGAIAKAAYWMTHKDSPVYIKPRISLAMAGWLLRFLGHANERHLRYAAPVLASLGLRTLALIDQFVSEHGGDGLNFQRQGLTYVCRTQKAIDESLHELAQLESLGLTGLLLDDAELKRREPLICCATAGGMFFEGQGHIEPLRFVEAMVREAESMGVEFLPHSEVFAVATRGRRISGVRTTRGNLFADEVVLAAGSWTPDLARLLGVHVPIQAGKGYAMILEGVNPGPNSPLLLVESKVAVTPREGSIRLAGTMELAGCDQSITPRRVGAIARAARSYLDLPESLEPVEVWRGLRPCTPDGLPMIGRSDRWENLTIAAGHAMLGLTLSAGTGELTAQLLTGEKTAVDPQPFHPSRW